MSSSTQLQTDLSDAFSVGVQLVFFFCSGISVVLFDALGIARGHITLFRSNPYL